MMGAEVSRMTFKAPTGALVFAVGILGVGVLLHATGLFAEMGRRWDDILYLSQQHMVLVAISGGLAILVGVSLGILLTRSAFRWAAEDIMQALNVGTTIPTLAILALSMSVLGIGERPAIFALWAATMLPIVRNTYTGILALPQHLIEAATGMGMTRWQILLRVELPNALYVILAGIRTALAINVGTVPLAFLIGGGGLGELIFTGIDLNEPAMMFSGALPTATLAILTDLVVGLVARLVVSRGVAPAT